MKIAIIGGGYAGLILVHGLFQALNNYDIIIDWISDSFSGGDLVNKYGDVTSNTPWSLVKTHLENHFNVNLDDCSPDE